MAVSAAVHAREVLRFDHAAADGSGDAAATLARRYTEAARSLDAR